MRPFGLALAGALAVAAAAPAQQSPPRLPAAPAPAAPAPTPSDPALDGYLQRWEQEMRNFQTLALTLERIDKDNVTQSVTKFAGNAYFMKAGSGPSARNLVLLETYRVAPNGAKELAEKFVCTGTFFYLLSPSTKEVQARELPRGGPGAMPDDNFLGMFGLRAAEAKRRYVLKKLNEDQYYVYVGVQPRFPRDMAEFEQARVVLDKRTFLPVQIWYRSPNKSESAWNMPPAQAQKNARLRQDMFDKPETPKGWKFVKVNPDADAQPTVIRNSGAP
jgi:TIGR03009 family protein